MKTLPYTLFFAFSFFIFCLPVRAQLSTLFADSLCVENIQLDPQKKGVLLVTLYNQGAYIGYPVVQVKVRQEMVANTKGTFETYGHTSDSRVVYALPTTLKKIPENFKCTVLVSQGHKKDYVSLPYPCKTTLKEND